MILHLIISFSSKELSGICKCKPSNQSCVFFLLQFTYMVILGSACRSFNSVQVWLNGLHIHWLLAPTHLQDQLAVHKNRSKTSQ